MALKQKVTGHGSTFTQSKLWHKVTKLALSKKVDEEELTTMQSYPESHGHLWHVSDSKLATLTEQVKCHGCDLAG